MAKVRVYELAKELGLPNKELIARLGDLGIAVASHSSSVEEAEAARVREAVAGGPAVSDEAESGGDRAAPGPQPDGEPVAEPEPVVEPEPAILDVVPEPATTATPEPEIEVEIVPEPTAEPEEAVIRVERGITVKDFAVRVGKSAGEIVKLLMAAGEMKAAPQSMTDAEVELVADELGLAVKVVSLEDADVEAEAEAEAEDAADEGAVARPPVVTVMGHVDHGKTSILDVIRKSNVVAGEAGGITQHIGAYQVQANGHPITFVDTPGHEAFTAMRARGAAVTDIAVLVVAADDGVMPQTVEALNHAQAAGVPVVVAVNKIDKDDADPTRVRQQLSEHGLVPSEWGGDTEFVDLSAKAELGIDDLLDTIAVVAELEDLKANPDGPARGTAIEAHLDKGRGPVATLLVRRGTLRVGDAVACGTAAGRVRAMLDDTGKNVKEAGPSTPVLLLGLSSVPAAGDDFRVVADDREARGMAQDRETRERKAELVTEAGPALTLESLFEAVQAGEVAELVLIVKADVQGSLEALADALGKLSTDQVKLKIIHRAVGAITENDVRLAEASRGLIVGFSVRPDRAARALAEEIGVEIRTYRVIYEVVDDIRAALQGLLAPEFHEVVLGQAEVRQLFRVPRIGVVAGCYVQEGRITRNARARVLRDGAVVYDGTVGSLRRFKEDVREVAAGYECGIGVERFQDVKEGDVIEGYEMKEVAATLDAR